MIKAELKLQQRIPCLSTFNILCMLFFERFKLALRCHNAACTIQVKTVQ